MSVERFFKPNEYYFDYYTKIGGICRFPNATKKIFLTFDDGPDVLLPLISEQLDSYNAKATFFVIGAKVEKKTHLVEMLFESNHTIANHTYNHENGHNTPMRTYTDSVLQCNDLLLPFFLGNPPLFRPPHGRITEEQAILIAKTNKIILWDNLTYDFDRTFRQEMCLKYAIDNTQDGSIVVFHDNPIAKKNLVYALPRYLEYFVAKGYSFETIK